MSIVKKGDVIEFARITDMDCQAYGIKLGEQYVATSDSESTDFYDELFNITNDDGCDQNISTNDIILPKTLQNIVHDWVLVDEPVEPDAFEQSMAERISMSITVGKPWCSGQSSMKFEDISVKDAMLMVQKMAQGMYEA